MVESKCSCGSKHFEDVDVTPSGVKERRYFTKCKQCGLVITTHGCGVNGQGYRLFYKFVNNHN